MSNTYKVYLITALDGRKYVGMTSRRISQRCFRTGYKSCTSMQAAIDQYGWDSFTVSILQDGLSREEASSLEKEMIALYDTTNPENGFNLASGGIRFRHNEISKKRISETSTPRSPEFKKKKYDEQAPYKHAVVQIGLDGSVVQHFASIREAAKATHSDPSNIRKCAQGILAKTNHFKWQFE